VFYVPANIMVGYMGDGTRLTTTHVTHWDNSFLYGTIPLGWRLYKSMFHLLTYLLGRASQKSDSSEAYKQLCTVGCTCKWHVLRKSMLLPVKFTASTLRTNRKWKFTEIITVQLTAIFLSH